MRNSPDGHPSGLQNWAYCFIIKYRSVGAHLLANGIPPFGQTEIIHYEWTQTHRIHARALAKIKDI